RFCREHGIAHEQCGKLVVATQEHELPRLESLEERGKANGLKDVRRLGAEELKEIEPHVAGIAGLLVPETGIVDFTQVSQCYAELIQKAGGVIQTKSRLLGCTQTHKDLVLHTTQGDIQARYLINCAGLQADRIARLCGAEPGLQIVPFRGEYYELNKERQF